MSKTINKTMDRSDLLSKEAKLLVKKCNNLINSLRCKGLYTTSWHGTLPPSKGLVENIKSIICRDKGVIKKSEVIGLENRGPDYEALPDFVDDARIPWYLLWEIFWVMKCGPLVKSGMNMLDAGGTSSLFTCCLASLGCNVHSVDISKHLILNGNKIAKKMNWNMFSYAMNMKALDFEDAYFDHAYSICVFEHLDYDLKQAALKEIARCLKPNGILSITFDYRSPAPGIVGYGKDPRSRNQLRSERDIIHNFLSTGHFELVGNQQFYDNGKSYLVHPQFDNAPYTFGAIFLKKKEKIRS